MDDSILQAERLKFFSNAMLLKSLCSQRAFERILEIGTSDFFNTDVRKDDLALGYKLVVQSALYGLLDCIITFPEILGLRGESHLYRWWSMVQGEDGTTLKAAICDWDTDFARVVGGIDDMVTSLLRAGVSWDRIATVNAKADLLSDQLLEIGRGCPVSVLSDAQPILDVERILRMSTIMLLHTNWGEGVQSSAFRYCRRKPTEWNHMELPGEVMFDIQTHRDQMSMFPEYDPTEFKPGWMVGKLAAVTVALQETDLWRKELGDPRDLLRQNTDPDQAWQTGTRILEETPGSDLTGIEFGLNQPLKLQAKPLPSLSAQRPPTAPIERLAALLCRRARLIGSRDSRSTLHIETIVSGLAINLPKDQPINILRVFHGSETDEVIQVSLAVLLPSLTALGDSSAWWVFDRPYRVKGLDYSNGLQLHRINDIAKSLGKCINWIDLTDVPVERLLALCDDRSFQYLRSQFEELERTASELRGVIPELLSAQLLSQTGYPLVKTSLKVAFPGAVRKAMEFDAVGIGFDNGAVDCKIIEVKGKSDSQHDLEKNIDRFNEKLRLADVNRPAIAKAVGCPESIQSVSGLFISMADRVEFSDPAMQPGLEFWDFGKFVAELRSAGFAERHIKLLQKSLLVWEVKFRGTSVADDPIE